MREPFRKFRSYWLQDISFVTLLLMLGFSIFVLPTILEHLDYSYHFQNTMFLIIFFVGIWSASNRKLIVLSSTLFVAGLMIKLLTIGSDSVNYKILEKTIFSLNTVVFIFINFKLLFRDDQFNFERVLGAVNVYLLIALLGSFLFELIHLMYGSSLTGDIQITNTDKDFTHYIYYSFVSLTTLGIGDIVPANQAARMLSVFLSTIGILFPAIVIARLVSLNNNFQK